MGLVNKWDSIYHLKRSSIISPIYSIWCENRRTFSFNSNNSNSKVPNTTSTENLFSSKNFHLDFIPSGRTCFLLISSDGSIEVFLEDSQGKFDISTIQAANNQFVVQEALAYQRPNGKIFIFLETSEFWTICELGGNELKEDSLELISKVAVPTSSGSSAKISKFIWSETKESLIHLQTDDRKDHLTMSFYNTSLQQTGSKSIVLPFEINEIYHSSRASNYILLTSALDQGTSLILNLNGEIVKQLCMELEKLEFDDFEDINDHYNNNNGDISDTNTMQSSPIIISPNGLVVAKIVYLDKFPLIIYSPIGEIHHQSKRLIFICFYHTLFSYRFTNVERIFGKIDFFHSEQFRFMGHFPINQEISPKVSRRRTLDLYFYNSG